MDDRSTAGSIMNDGIHAYLYDAENRIAAVGSGSTAVYTYDAEGRRVAKTAGSASYEYLFDLGGRAVTELLAGTATTNRTEAYAGGRHLATQNVGLGTSYFIHSDWLGTERARSNTAGTVTETCTSLPYGDDLVCSGTDVSPLHFTGKMRDAETGLDDFPARYYSSGQGRWYSPDWASAQVPVPYADLHNPQSLNLYDYVGSDPTNHADADGHFWLDRILGFGDAKKKAKDSQGQADAKTAQEKNQGFVLPKHPKDVSNNPNWKPDPKFDPQGKTRPGTQQWVDGDGNRLRFDPKDPSKSPSTEGGKDHYHYNDGDDHLQPGETVPEPAPSKPAPEASLESESAPTTPAASVGPNQQQMQEVGAGMTMLLILYYAASVLN
jgi:RHS repeat-associated protein